MAVVLGGCQGPQRITVRPAPVVPSVTPAPAVPPGPSGGRATVPIDPDSSGNGVLVAKLADAAVVSTEATVTDLSAAETQALLARLEPLPAIDNAKAPTVRPASLAPPRAGSVIPIAFVKPTGKTIADSPISQSPAPIAPLPPPQILPVGEVKAESEIRVRFTEPMVAVAEVNKAVPGFISITPPVEGTWRWIDTRIAQFTSKAPRLPAATEYTIRVAAGARAVSGAVLSTEQKGTFSTPPVSITLVSPSYKARPDSPLLVRFDQGIDPAAIVKFLRVEDKAHHVLPFKTLTLDEAIPLLERSPRNRVDRKKLEYPHQIILAPKTTWPAGISARVVLAAKAPSREGPRVSTQESAGMFEVAKPFVVEGIECDDMPKPRMTGLSCSAWGYLRVRFSNEIDRTTYHSKFVQFEGEELQDHEPSHDSVTLTTPRPVGKTYTLALGDGITDEVGQPLGGPKRIAITTKQEHFDPYLQADEGLYILDPRFEIPQWVVEAQALKSLRIQLYQVQPSDYFAFAEYEAGKRATPPGKRVYDKQEPVGARYAATARVDLRPALGAAGTGHVVAVATTEHTGNGWVDRKHVAWIQVSRLGITARLDGEHVNAYAMDITPTSFMKPIAGAKASLLVEGRTDAAPPVPTDADGHAAFDLLPRKNPTRSDNRRALLVADNGTDSVFSAIEGDHEKTVREREARWYVTDDRFTYKPGETVYVKGWVRWSTDGVNPDIITPPPTDKVRYTLTDARGNRIAAGDAKFSPQGGFDMQVALPANANLGIATFSFETDRQSIRHPIDIEEFRTPAYGVELVDDVTHAGATPLVLGENIEMSAEAKYYAGGGLPGARIQWNATLAPAAYRPPGWDRYRFSPPRKRSARLGWYEDDQVAAVTAAETSALSGASTSGITFGMAALPGRVPGVLTVDAVVTDIDRQTIRASSRPILVHPSTLYVGIRLQPDQLDQLQVVVTDIDGKPVAGVPIDVAIEGVLGSEQDRDGAKVIDAQHCAVTSATAPVTCGFKREDIQTSYTALATVKDGRGRTNSTQFDIPWWSTADSDFAVVADKQKYVPGDIAKLDIRSKELPATAILSFARQGVFQQKRIDLTKPSTIVEFPIEESYVENVFVVLDRVAKRQYQDKRNPLPISEQASTYIELPVDTEAMRLSMRTRSTEPLVEPGAPATFEVEVSHGDKPMVGAEVALIVVDEAILALSSKTHPDPLAPFYKEVEEGTRNENTLDMVHDSASDVAEKPGYHRWSLDAMGGHGTGSGYGVGGGRGGMRGRTTSVPAVRADAMVKSRKDFRPTAVFSPTMLTDEHGKVKVSVTMPDSLTRFRIVALATANTRYFGKAESTIVTQRKINARTVAPRFLTQGDSFSLPVVVQNLDRAPRTIDVGVRAANLLGTGAAGKRVVVPGGQRAEVRFDLKTQSRGRVVIQTIASSGDFADASNIELPVYEPATTESFATYGSLDDQPLFERLEVPADVFTDVGGVEAEVSSTQLQELTDAFWYLYAYPYECAEQRSGRMLATSAMYDILDAFATAGRPTRDELAKTRAADVQKLTRDQNADGGWGYYPAMKTDPFVSIQVLGALAAQKEQGAAIKKAIAYVNGLLKKPATDATSVSLTAAGLAAIASTGTDVTARAAALHALATKLGAYPVDAKARILGMLAGQARYKAVREKLVAELLSATHETASAATVTTSFSEGERLLLVSNTKTTALVLDALLRESPQHALVAKLARGILDARRRGRWVSTQENVVVLQAMRRYFDIYEKDTPNYTGKLWLGNAAYVEQTFAGRSSARGVAKLGWTELAPGTSHDIALQKTGPGRMYYRLGITYAPKQTNLPPLDAGFIVRRSYKGVDDPSDVVQLPDGHWQIKLGARVQVVLEAVNTSVRHGVALVDPLPAGLEAVNTRLATSERAVADADADGWDYINMRDNRSEAFMMQLREGTHRFSYTARATTPGTFLAAPAKAEEMYSPETFGRSSGTTVVVR
ncbi:MAG TPA: alpha-2-macroglobulin family protein [Kofleriaceae bacterium]|nr:alpha-2-macroglobulin family protein [Kofleriaceae bacterium]